jgi:hypothetical protein
VFAADDATRLVTGSVTDRGTSDESGSDFAGLYNSLAAAGKVLLPRVRTLAGTRRTGRLKS